MPSSYAGDVQRTRGSPAVQAAAGRQNARMLGRREAAYAVAPAAPSQQTHACCLMRPS